MQSELISMRQTTNANLLKAMQTFVSLSFI